MLSAVQVPAADCRAGAPLGRHPQRRLRLRVGPHRLLLRRHDHRRGQVGRRKLLQRDSSGRGPGPGWVDFDLGVTPSCPSTEPLLPNSRQPRQNWAEGGTLKIQVNPTQSTSG